MSYTPPFRPEDVTVADTTRVSKPIKHALTSAHHASGATMLKSAGAQQRGPVGPHGEDPTPTYNIFIRSNLGKGEVRCTSGSSCSPRDLRLTLSIFFAQSAIYADQLQGLGEYV